MNYSADPILVDRNAKQKKLFAKTCQSFTLNAYVQVFSRRVLKPQVFPPLPVGDAPALPRSLRQAERGIFLPTTWKTA
jgi:hypothetical protein